MWKTAVTGIILWMCWVSLGLAQHMYLDVNGDGKATDLDILGTDQSVDLWIETDRNRDGTTPAQTSCSGRPLTVNSYEFILRVIGGDIEWGEFQNLQPSMNTRLGPLFSPVEYYDGFMGLAALPPGAYKLGTLRLTIRSGRPEIKIAATGSLWSGARTSFGSRCNGVDNDNTLKFGGDVSLGGLPESPGDWLDATGVKSAGSVTPSPTASNGAFSYEITPNPANPQSHLTVRTTRAGYLRINMFDVAGRIVMPLMMADRVGPGAHELGIVTESLPSGVYFIKIEAEEKTASEKFVVLK